MQLIVGLLTIDLFIPTSSSLKEKRLVIKSIKDKIHHKFNVSIAEVDFQDKWQRAQLAVVQVGNDYAFIEKNMNTIFNMIESVFTVEIVKHSFEFL
ncbi:MAG: DUF503 domain-containing protein [Calditrichaeota bacterium]|nr:DUF503 domain-containing protein [Calditrichota bacterium]RQV92587.1 MAG: DUF503 domain-containing protein [bacterium]RQW07585.1 MAG: DUF503 domain-containing protein [Calditrichota bacterium]